MQVFKRPTPNIVKIRWPLYLPHVPGGVQDAGLVRAAARAGEVRGADPREAGGRALAARLRPRHRRPQAQEEGDPEDVPAGYWQNVPVVRTNICIVLQTSHVCHRIDDDNFSSTFIRRSSSTDNTFEPPQSLADAVI